MTTCKKMTVADARTELERQGFAVFSDSEAGDSGLSAVLSRWDLYVRIDVMVFLHDVASGNLTNARLEQDLAQLSHRIDALYPGDLPPFGFGRGRFAIVVYLLNEGGIIEPAALQRLLATPPTEWCAFTFLAAQDGKGDSYYLHDRSTPSWGAAYYPELRYWAGLLTGRPVPDTPPPKKGFYKMANILVIPFIVVECLIIPKALLYFGSFLLIHFLVAFFCQENSRRRSSRRAPLLDSQNQLEVI